MWHMGRALGYGAMLAALVGLISSDVSAQKKKKDGKDKKEYPAATDADYKSIQKKKEMVGTLVAVDSKVLIIRVEYPRYEPNPKYKLPKDKNPGAAQQNQIWKTYNDLQIQWQKAAFARTAKEAMQAQQRIAQDMAKLQQQMAQQAAKAGANQPKFDPKNSPFLTIIDTKDFDLEMEEKVVTRKLFLPFEYDDTGKEKVYTTEEKAELRGDDKTKPGYMAKLEEFVPGQDVKLTLKAPKKKEKDKAVEKEEKDKDKDKETKEPEEVLRPTITMMVLTKDNSSSSVQGAADKKKKDKK